MLKLARTIIALSIIRLWFVPPVCAAEAVQLVLSGDQKYYQQVADVFTQHLAALQPAMEIRRHVLNGDNDPPAVKGLPLVAVGSQATRKALALYPEADILSLLIPITAWLDLRAAGSEHQRFAAIVIDQPLERAVLLGKLLKPDAQRFGAVFGPASQANQKASVARVDAMGIDLQTKNLPPSENPISVLSPLMDASDVFVAVPDRADFNRNIARWVLRLGFRNKIPVIGFSSSYTEAGALASVYSSPENIGRHGAELLDTLLDAGSPETGSGAADWRAYYPRYYTLQTDKDVARVLGITVPPLDELYRKYQQALLAM